ncbi:MAG: hypothetical protein Q9160_007923 [Pyrenula sp. 1 TL-2023]
MYSTKLVHVLAPALLLTNYAHGLGCNGSGLKFNEVTTNSDDLASLRTDFCQAAAKAYTSGATFDKCYSFATTANRIDMEVKNNNGNGGTLTSDDCVSGMTIEMNGCDKGSTQNHNNLQFKDDPNAGQGNGCVAWPPGNVTKLRRERY